MAHQMHQEEIEEAHYDGSIITLLNPDGDMLQLSEQYYNETFGGQDNINIHSLTTNKFDNQKT